MGYFRPAPKGDIQTMKKGSVQALCGSMRALGLQEGKTPTAFPFLSFYRFTSAEIEIPQTKIFIFIR